jgi:type II secretory pathway pseudopilin PulG
MVELLAVIAIIALLISILIPAVNVIRTKAKTVSTQASIGSIGAGIEAFRAENRLGGGYPPSVTDAGGNPVEEYHARSPYTELPGGGISNDIGMSGTGLLVWALSGADLLGTPGFRTFNTSETEWAADTRARNGGAYELDNNTGQPEKTRFGPYVDDKVSVSQYNSAEQSFDIEAEVEAREALGEPRVAREYPVYLDAFGFPLLYYRADPAGIAAWDDDPLNPGSAPLRGIYHWADNGGLVDNQNRDRLMLTSGNQPHSMEKPSGGGLGGARDPEPGQFAYFIWNQSVAARRMPHNAQAYLLFSPGPDGRYGTSDDIGNFKQSGE